MRQWLVGVDEAGRGPLAGPVAVGVVKVPADFDWGLIPGVNDSKKLSPQKRTALFRRATELRRSGLIDWSVKMTSAADIDRIGIVPAIRGAQGQAFRHLKLNPRECSIKLDGGLRAPGQYSFQETIIKGDSKEKVIGLASILAKVTRDRYMGRIASQFAPYDFAVHKGYGTKAHRAAILQNGLSAEHRQSFCHRLRK